MRENKVSAGKERQEKLEIEVEDKKGSEGKEGVTRGAKNQSGGKEGVTRE